LGGLQGLSMYLSRLDDNMEDEDLAER